MRTLRSTLASTLTSTLTPTLSQGRGGDRGMRFREVPAPGRALSEGRGSTL